MQEDTSGLSDSQAFKVSCYLVLMKLAGVFMPFSIRPSLDHCEKDGDSAVPLRGCTQCVMAWQEALLCAGPWVIGWLLISMSLCMLFHRQYDAVLKIQYLYRKINWVDTQSHIYCECIDKHYFQRAYCNLKEITQYFVKQAYLHSCWVHAIHLKLNQGDG